MDSTGQAPRAGSQILVVATHGGPQQRQPDIDRRTVGSLRQGTVIDSSTLRVSPMKTGTRGIQELKHAIARVAATLPEWDAPCPKVFKKCGKPCKTTEATYLPWSECSPLAMNTRWMRTGAPVRDHPTVSGISFITTRPVLAHIVVLKPIGWPPH